MMPSSPRATSPGARPARTATRRCRGTIPTPPTTTGTARIAPGSSPRARSRRRATRRSSPTATAAIRARSPSRAWHPRPSSWSPRCSRFATMARCGASRTGWSGASAGRSRTRPTSSRCRSRPGARRPSSTTRSSRRSGSASSSSVRPATTAPCTRTASAIRAATAASSPWPPTTATASRPDFRRPAARSTSSARAKASGRPSSTTARAATASCPEPRWQRPSSLASRR